MRYDRTVIAYHGCDALVAERLLHGEPFKKSQNDYDWLGEGIYFWSTGPTAPSSSRTIRSAGTRCRRRRSWVRCSNLAAALI
jgi:hypothetical protein